MPKQKPSNRVRKARKRLHLTQGEFADRLGVSRRTVTRWETDRNIPHEVFLARLRSLTREPIAVEGD